MSARSIDDDIITAIQDITGMFVGDDFEGWDEYWEDQRRVEAAILTLLHDWQDEAHKKAARNGGFA